MASNSSLSIPVELLQLILRSFSQHELLQFCTISRSVHDEVLRLLYRNVDLINAQTSQIVSWAARIAIHPKLAQHVRSLSLPTVLQQPEWNLPELDLVSPPSTLSLDFISEIRSSLRIAMHAIKYLRSLSIADPRGYVYSQRVSIEYLVADVFLGCDFRLQSFRYTNDKYFISIPGMPLFLREQDEIMDWQTGTDFEIAEAEVSPYLLPNLRVAHTNYNPQTSSTLLLQLIAFRPLERLRLDLSDPCNLHEALHALSAFTQCTESLTHLYLCFERISSASDQQHALFLESIAQLFPNLKLLYYADLLLPHMFPWDWCAFPQALSQFKHLEILRIDLENTSRGGLPGPAAAAYHGFTERCMESCPTLSCLSCVGWADVEMDSEGQVIESFVRVAAFMPFVELCMPVYVEKSIWRHI